MSITNPNSSTQSGDLDRSQLSHLIVLAKGGSKSALGRALNICRPWLLRVARKNSGKRVGREIAASDVVQDAFVYASKDFDRFRGHEANSFVSWLCMILANRLAHLARRASAAKRGPDAQFENCLLDELDRGASRSQDTPSAIAEGQEISQLIRVALERMSTRDRSVLALRFEEQMTFQQIGTQMGLSEDAARVLFHRAVKRLKRVLPIAMDS